jgi:hypothetical protein
MISWLDENQTASTEEFESRQKQLETVVWPFILNTLVRLCSVVRRR